MQKLISLTPVLLFSLISAQELSKPDYPNSIQATFLITKEPGYDKNNWKNLCCKVHEWVDQLKNMPEDIPYEQMMLSSWQALKTIEIFVYNDSHLLIALDKVNPTLPSTELRPELKAEDIEHISVGFFCKRVRITQENETPWNNFVEQASPILEMVQDIPSGLKNFKSLFNLLKDSQSTGYGNGFTFGCGTYDY